MSPPKFSYSGRVCRFAQFLLFTSEVHTTLLYSDNAATDDDEAHVDMCTSCDGWDDRLTMTESS